MNGLAKTEKTLEERGLPSDSYFELIFEDGTSVTEKECNWSSISEELNVEYFDMRKTVFVCTLPVKCAIMWHGILQVHLCVPEGYEVFQAVRSETVIIDNKKTNKVLGRTIGLIKDGEVIEEQFLNGIEETVLGRRK